MARKSDQYSANGQIKISKMIRPQIKMLLDYLGVPLDDQPSNVPELKSLLEAFQKQDREKYDIAYTIIIDHEIPGDVTENVMKYSDASRIISEIVSELEAGSIKAIQSAFEEKAVSLVDAVEATFKKAVETESKKYNRVEYVVKVNKAPEMKLETPLSKQFKKMLALATMRKNQLLVGPAGSGKTYSASLVAKALKLEFAAQSCSAGVTETTFTGRLLPLGKSGQFEYVESDFVRIYENGGVFLLDEFDAADPNVGVFLNMALANDSFYCSQRLGNTLVKKHKDFVCIAAANTYGSGSTGMYSGRNTLDAATLDRFRCGVVEFDYSEDVERSLVDGEILAWGLKVREKIKTKKLNKIMSTRFLRDATDMKRGVEWTLAEIAEQYFCDWSKDELAAVGVFDESDKVSAFKL